MGLRHRCADLVDELESLRQDEAVVRVGGDRVGRGKIRDDGRARIRRIDVEHVTPRNIMAETVGVAGVQQLEHVSTYVLGVLPEKRFDVVPVDRRPTIAAPDVAQRRRAAQRAESRRSTQAPCTRVPDFGRRACVLLSSPADGRNLAPSADPPFVELDHRTARSDAAVAGGTVGRDRMPGEPGYRFRVPARYGSRLGASELSQPAKRLP
jgi:hypothetical protein